MNAEKTNELKDKMSQLEDDLEASEKRAEEAEKKEDAMYEEFQRDLRQQLDDIPVEHYRWSALSCCATTTAALI